LRDRGRGSTPASYLLELAGACLGSHLVKASRLLLAFCAMAARVFFSRLPQGKLTPPEVELRDLLHKAAAVAQRLLPKGRIVPLQDWVETRIPGELFIGTTSSGRVDLRSLKDEEEDGEEQPPVSSFSAGAVPSKGLSSDAELWFRELPTDSFSVEEERVRDAITGVLAQGPLPISQVAFDPAVVPAVKACLPRHVLLVDWIERRIGAEVVVYNDEQNHRLCRLATPLKDEGKEQVDPFADLPEDSFTPEEERLRTAIIDFLATWKSKALASLSDIGSDPSVKAARAAYTRCGSLKEWIERRIGGEIELQKDERGQYLVHLTAAAQPIVTARFRELEKQNASGPPATAPAATAASDAAQMREAFFTDLPTDAFLPEEEQLRSVLFDFLASWKSKEFATLSHLGGDKNVQVAKAQLLPQGVTLREWIERRIGGELELRKDDKGQQQIHLTPAAKPIIAKRYKELEKAGALEGARETHNKETHEETRNSFFAGLPDHELLAEELSLREALLTLLDEHTTGSRSSIPLILADAGQNSEVKRHKASFIPKDVPLKDWIERRIGGEIATRRDASGQVIISLRDKGNAGGGNRRQTTADSDGDKELAKARQHERREAFFEGLPSDGFTEAEEVLREAILSFLSDWNGEGAPSLSQAGSDPGIRECRAAVLPEGCGVSLKDWIDRRIGGEVETRITDPISGKVVIGVRGILDVNPKIARKRKAEAPGSAGDKGKGKSARVGRAADGYKRSR